MRKGKGRCRRGGQRAATARVPTATRGRSGLKEAGTAAFLLPQRKCPPPPPRRWGCHSRWPLTRSSHPFPGGRRGRPPHPPACPPARPPQLRSGSGHGKVAGWGPVAIVSWQGAEQAPPTQACPPGRLSARPPTRPPVSPSRPPVPPSCLPPCHRCVAGAPQPAAASTVGAAIICPNLVPGAAPPPPRRQPPASSRGGGGIWGKGDGARRGGGGGALSVRRSWPASSRTPTLFEQGCEGTIISLST